MIIFEILGRLTAWLMLHLIVKSSASVEVTLAAWYRVLMMGLLWIWIWVIDVAMLFLMPVSEMIYTCKWFNSNMIAMSLSWWEQSSRLLSLRLIKGWKEKQLGKMSIRWELGENSIFRELNEENTLLNLLLMSMIEPLIFSFWQWVSKSRERGY